MTTNTYPYYFENNNCPFKVDSFLVFDQTYLVSSDISEAPIGKFKKGIYKLSIYTNIFYCCKFLALIHNPKTKKESIWN